MFKNIFYFILILQNHLNLISPYNLPANNRPADGNTNPVAVNGYSDDSDRTTALLSNQDERRTDNEDEGTAITADNTEDSYVIYTNEWAVHLPLSLERASQIVDQLGYRNLGQIGDFEEFYLIRRVDHPPKSKRGAPHHTTSLNNNNHVLWAEQQKYLNREKREFLRFDKRLEKTVRNSDEQVKRLGKFRQNKDAYNNYDKYGDPQFFAKYLKDQERGLELLERARSTYQDIPQPTLSFNDDHWKNQWYLHDTRVSTTHPKTDLHIVPVWLKNITGRGVVITIIDDGIEYTNKDIAQNYDPEASYDINDEDDDPLPRYDPTDENNHGTRCAGEVAMSGNNNFCGVGVAYNSKIGGLRILDGKITDVLEGRALSFRVNHVDIFSASWGPMDNGKSLGGPGTMAQKALEKGIFEGRGGRGVIYVWAGGNGGGRDDNCNCDGYIASIYTLAINSVSQGDETTWYAEGCPAIIASAYSSNNRDDSQIVSSDLHGGCTDSHSGTSAAAPLVAGVIALAFEANKNLTWRDVQHLLVWTSELSSVEGNVGWTRNSAGYWVNDWLGFGVVNAATLVNLALNFTTVPDKFICTKFYLETQLPLFLKNGVERRIELKTDGCHGDGHEINVLEHVQLIASIKYTFRGHLQIYLVSPQGTISKILSERKLDDKGSFNDWPFMTLHSWGEKPNGTWTLIIKDTTDFPSTGWLTSVKLVLHGTKQLPSHVIENGGKRIYNYEYNNERIRGVKRETEKAMYYEMYENYI